MNRYFIQLAYHGKNYHGWQLQNNAKTVQEVITHCMSLIIGEPLNLVGCGRTDQGVHARKYYAHFDCSKEIHNKAILSKINSFLPKDIVVKDIFKVNSQANARFDAVSRTYRYFINTQKEVFNNDFSYYVRHDLDVEQMNKAAQILFKHSDFTSFAKFHSQSKTNICQIFEAKFIKRDFGIIFTISANRFLRNMVRAIVGTLIEVGIEKISLIDFENIIKAKNRNLAGASAPPQGLFLWDVMYPDTIKIVSK